MSADDRELILFVVVCSASMFSCVLHCRASFWFALPCLHLSSCAMVCFAAVYFAILCFSSALVIYIFMDLLLHLVHPESCLFCALLRHALLCRVNYALLCYAFRACVPMCGKISPQQGLRGGRSRSMRQERRRAARASAE